MFSGGQGQRGKAGEYVFSIRIFEVSILEGIVHPCIVQLLDVCAVSPIRLVLDYGGEYLRNAYENPEFQTCMIPGVAEQMLRGVAYLHSQGTVHCNLNTWNVLIAADHKVRIMGLDEARVQRPGFRSEVSNLEAACNGLHIGTLGYRAPEILMAFTRFDYKVDSWSMGCIIAELAGREPVFTAESIRGVLAQVLSLIGSPPEDMYRELSVYSGWEERFALQAKRPN